MINKHEDIDVDDPWDVSALGEDISVAEQCVVNDRRGDRRLGEEWVMLNALLSSACPLSLLVPRQPACHTEI